MSATQALASAGNSPFTRPCSVRRARPKLGKIKRHQCRPVVAHAWRTLSRSACQACSITCSRRLSCKAAISAPAWSRASICSLRYCQSAAVSGTPARGGAFSTRSPARPIARMAARVAGRSKLIFSARESPNFRPLSSVASAWVKQVTISFCSIGETCSSVDSAKGLWAGVPIASKCATNSRTCAQAFVKATSSQWRNPAKSSAGNSRSPASSRSLRRCPWAFI